MFKYFVTDENGTNYELSFKYELDTHECMDIHGGIHSTWYDIIWECSAINPSPVTCEACYSIAEFLEQDDLIQSLCVEDYKTEKENHEESENN